MARHFRNPFARTTTVDGKPVTNYKHDPNTVKSGRPYVPTKVPQRVMNPTVKP